MVPGDEVVLEVEIERLSRRGGWGRGRATVDGDEAARGRLLFVFAPTWVERSATSADVAVSGPVGSDAGQVSHDTARPGGLTMQPTRSLLLRVPSPWSWPGRSSSATAAASSGASLTGPRPDRHPRRRRDVRGAGGAAR